MIPTTHPAWTPSMGAWVGPEGATCRVWAPASSRVDVIVEQTATGITVDPAEATKTGGNAGEGASYSRSNEKGESTTR